MQVILHMPLRWYLQLNGQDLQSYLSGNDFSIGPEQKFSNHIINQNNWVFVQKKKRKKEKKTTQV